MKTIWNCILTLLLTLTLILFSSYCCWLLISDVPMFKQIGAALGLSELSWVDYVIAMTLYTVLYGLVKGATFVFKLLFNAIWE